MYLTCVGNDTLFGEREHCYSKFYQFDVSTWHHRTRVVLAYGEYGEQQVAAILEALREA